MNKYIKPDWGVGLEKATNDILCNIANEFAIKNALMALEMTYARLDSYSHEEYKKLIQAIMND